MSPFFLLLSDSPSPSCKCRIKEWRPHFDKFSYLYIHSEHKPTSKHSDLFRKHHQLPLLSILVQKLAMIRYSIVTIPFPPLHSLSNSTTLGIAPTFVPNLPAHGTMDVLLSCVITHGLCIWTPGYPDVNARRITLGFLVYTMSWMLVALFMPRHHRVKLGPPLSRRMARCDGCRRDEQDCKVLSSSSWAIAPSGVSSKDIQLS